MIYVFENENNNASIVFNENVLTEDQKKIGIAIEKLPVSEEIPGKHPVLKADKSTGSVWYEYIDLALTAEEVNVQLQKKVDELEQAILELTSIIAGGTA